MLKSIQKRKNRLRSQRKARIRANIFGTVDAPRLTIFKSNKHIYAQIVNDTEGTTLASVDGEN